MEQVVSWRLCVGCGSCYYICPEKKIEVRDIYSDGIRPVPKDIHCGDCQDCLKVCPGLSSIHCLDQPEDFIQDLQKGFGPILELWEGYASDPAIRHCGSSGGAATALALYCIEKEGMDGVLHIAAKQGIPWKNETVISHTRGELLSRTGSRYAPASPCDGLDMIENAANPCIFIGKPCDVVGLRKAALLRSGLRDNLGLVIGIFCAGSPSTKGTLDLLAHHGLKNVDVEKISYRGMGWPGDFSVKVKEKYEPLKKISYKESWSFLQHYRPYRCHLCPDGTSEFADISCGDPWYRDIKKGEQGYSLVLVRTEKGRKILQGAVESGYLQLEKSDPKILEDSQRSLLSKRYAIWGRLIAFKAFGIPTPGLEGFSLLNNWLRLNALDKARSIFGTMNRIVKRKYYLPYRIDL